MPQTLREYFQTSSLEVAQALKETDKSSLQDIEMFFNHAMKSLTRSMAKKDNNALPFEVANASDKAARKKIYQTNLINDRLAERLWHGNFIPDSATQIVNNALKTAYTQKLQ